MGRFQDLTVIVTGATGGFGHRAAERLAAEGARLVLSDLESGPLEELASSLGAESATLAGDIAPPGRPSRGRWLRLPSRPELIQDEHRSRVWRSYEFGREATLPNPPKAGRRGDAVNALTRPLAVLDPHLENTG